MCAGQKVGVDGNTIFKACQASPIKLGDRFGKEVSLHFEEADLSCNKVFDTLVYFPSGMLDEWNPYEGLHQHTAAFMTARALNISLEGASVGFAGLVSPHRGFPLLGLWNMTFDKVIFGSAVCARQIIIPTSSEHSFNTWHQPTCDNKELLQDYRTWMRSFLSPLHEGGDDCFFVVVIKRPPKLRRHEENLDAFVGHIATKRFAGKKVCVRTMVPHTLTVKMQLEMISASQMLIGTHGGALTWLLALPLDGIVVELSAKAPHYRHWAHALGVHYKSINTGIAWGTRSYSIKIEAAAREIGFT
tara:strand:+ start:117 stop:1022 length:906 start_codon:yes stop_codon:yes gene_type:complete